MYTEKEILQMLGIENYKRQGQARLIPLCARAGLDIRAVSGGGRGVTVKYEIIEDRRTKDEKWIDCIYDNNYEVSDLGGIRRKVSKNNLGYTSENGYIKVALRAGQIGVHRAVYFSFHPEDFANEEVITIDHINGIKSDNSLNNLRPLSRLENIRCSDENQTEIKGLVAQLLNKYGYEELVKKLHQLL